MSSNKKTTQNGNNAKIPGINIYNKPEKRCGSFIFNFLN